MSKKCHEIAMRFLIAGIASNVNRFDIKKVYEEIMG